MLVRKLQQPLIKIRFVHSNGTTPTIKSKIING